MKEIKNYIDSGIIERYVLGMTSAEEQKEIEILGEIHPEIKEAIANFSNDLELQAQENAVEPPLTIKPMVMASLDYIDRLSKGEPITFPPLLNEASTIKDYAVWLDRYDMVLSPNFKDIYAKIIGYTPQVTTAIVWIKEMTPPEVHDDEHERFLIVEGTCSITIGDNSHQLIAGDYLAIPLYTEHYVKVTSSIPCKVILQRVAA